ncbi:MAG: hypothetical protein ACLVLH_02740 [Eisenbergiella massiliensis]
MEYLQSQGVKLSLLIDEGGMIMEEPIGGVKEPMRWWRPGKGLW